MSLLTGCLDETIPTNSVTSEMLSSSTKAAEATMAGMAAQMIAYNICNRAEPVHYDFGIGSIMRVRDIFTGDYAVENSIYDQYYYFEINDAMGPRYVFAQFTWNTLYKMILTANSAIGGFPADSDSPVMLGYRGIALAQRAGAYLDAARMYEFLENDVVPGVSPEGKPVVGLTVPIVTDETDQSMASENPRATHEEIFKFIENDLNEAEQLIVNSISTAKNLPSLGVVYGLKARLYMWNEDYDKAAEFARRAINQGYSPVTQSQWLDQATGFNTFNQAWMWGCQYTKEDNAVKSGIINWVAMSCNEALWGYAAAGPYNMISKELYDRMNDTDFRKLSYKAPEGSPLSGNEPYIQDPKSVWPQLPTYSSIKFRPANGNIAVASEGNVVAFPLMRVEEMYLIEAEATAHNNPQGGKALLEAFVQGYRDPAYTCNATTPEDVVEECFQQKRIELWGEGQIFFDYKRLNHSVTRAYPGTNFQPAARFNTNGRPAWMNMVITRQEGLSNLAITDYNNPDPSQAYKAIDIE